MRRDSDDLTHMPSPRRTARFQLQLTRVTVAGLAAKVLRGEK
jgi:hypothetical protein